MKFPVLLVSVLLVSLFGITLIVYPQAPGSRPDAAGADVRLPSGRLQRDEMAKADHERNLEDADALIKLAEDLKAEIEKNTQHVLSVSSIKKTEEVEKIAKRIRSRMKRY